MVLGGWGGVNADKTGGVAPRLVAIEAADGGSSVGLEEAVKT